MGSITQGRTARLYIVDSLALARDGIQALVERAGHVVVGGSHNPKVAFGEIEALVPDIVLLDLNLGPYSGFELLFELRRRRLPVRTVVVTMSTLGQHIAESLRLGVTGFVLKQAPAAVLLEGIETVMQGRLFVSEEVSELAIKAAVEYRYGDPLSDLSPREREIATLVVRGCSSSIIGQKLGLSPKTVDTYRSRLMRKVGADNTPGLVRWAILSGLVDLHE